MSFAILRAVKHASKRSVKASLSHHLRERDTPNADPKKTHLNINSCNISSDALVLLNNRLEGVKMQKKSNIAIEYLITTSAETPKDFNALEYLQDAKKWVENKHGAENVVFSSFQFDEKTPHLAIVVVPRVYVAEKTFERTNKDGDKMKVKIDAHVKVGTNEFLDGKKKLSDMQTDFFNTVGKVHGLSRGLEGSTAKHEDVKGYYESLNKAIENVEKKEASLLNIRDDYAKAAAGHKSERLEAMEQIYINVKPLLNELKTYKKRISSIEKLKKKLEEQISKESDKEAILKENNIFKKALIELDKFIPGIINKFNDFVESVKSKEKKEENIKKFEISVSNIDKFKSNDKLKR